MEMKRLEIRIPKYDGEKITQIRKKIELVFDGASSWDNVTIAERYNITGEGDLIMIIR